MSYRRAENRRRQRALHKGRTDRDRKARPKFEVPQGNYAVQMGWVEDEDALEEGRMVTHDSLIELMGDTRTGGVHWSWAEGLDALAMLDVLERNNRDPRWADYAAQIRGRLTTVGGWLVVAIAPGKAPS